MMAFPPGKPGWIACRPTAAGCAWCCWRKKLGPPPRCWASARAIAQALPARLDAALRFLWQAGRETGDPDDAPAAFMEGFAPSDLVMAADGGYVLHLAPRDAAWFMPGYWPSLRFSADHAPAGWTCES